jgi:hypothetical protein
LPRDWARQRIPQPIAFKYESQEKLDMQTAIRVFLLAAAISIIFAPAMQAASAAKPDCDR